MKNDRLRGETLETVVFWWVHFTNSTVKLPILLVSWMG